MDRRERLAAWVAGAAALISLSSVPGMTAGAVLVVCVLFLAASGLLRLGRRVWGRYRGPGGS